MSVKKKNKETLFDDVDFVISSEELGEPEWADRPHSFQVQQLCLLQLL